jgi:hypothetical protein
VTLTSSELLLVARAKRCYNSSVTCMERFRSDLRNDSCSIFRSKWKGTDPATIPMKYQLVLQWPSSLIDYDTMINVEESLIANLSGDNEVDGHDAGAGELNIFIRTDSPDRVFASIKTLFAAQGHLAGVRAAFRLLDGETYTVLWPKGLKSFKVT